VDPLTQGVVGTTAAQLVARKQVKIAAAIIGFFSGMAADLDVLITSSTDPLLFLEFHRHFTHALIFIPVGALLCTVMFRVIFRRWFTSNQVGFRETYLFSFAGYATHAVLDACTTYGTQLFWPFSNARVAWNNVSVIDPLFTIPLIIVIYFATFKRSTKMAYIGAIYAFTYLGLGVVQGQRAQAVAYELAAERGHAPQNFRVLRGTKIYEGTSTEKLDLRKHFTWLDKRSQQAVDIERFRWFSNQHLGLDPNNENRIIDIRYSLIPNQVTGMWGIVLSPSKGATEHVEWTSNRPKGKLAMQKVAELWDMLLGR